MSSSFAYQPANPFSTAFISPNRVKFRFSSGPSGANPSSINNHLEGLLAKLKGTRRATIVGPHGTGKSTLLHTFLPKLQQTFPKVAFHHLNNDPSIGFLKRWKERSRANKRIMADFAELPEEGLIIIDGWEQLGNIARWRISSAAVSKKISLLTTCHHRPAGWTIIYETTTSTELVRSLAKDLLKDSPYKVQKLIDTQLKARRLNAKTNVRNLWFEMYDVVQEFESQGADDSFLHAGSQPRKPN